MDFQKLQQICREAKQKIEQQGQQQEKSRATFAYPLDRVIKAIISPPVQITEDEYSPSDDEFSSQEYDELVVRAFRDIESWRIQTGEDPTKVEHPHDRLRRIGEESIAAGKRSRIYLIIKARLKRGRLTLPLPKHPQNSMRVAQRRLDIAIEYKKYLTGYVENPPYKRSKVSEFSLRDSDPKRTPVIKLSTAKAEFSRLNEWRWSKKTIDRALKEHNINWSAYSTASPRKGKRAKKI